MILQALYSLQSWHAPPCQPGDDWGLEGAESLGEKRVKRIRGILTTCKASTWPWEWVPGVERRGESLELRSRHCVAVIHPRVPHCSLSYFTFEWRYWLQKFSVKMLSDKEDLSVHYEIIGDGRSWGWDGKSGFLSLDCFAHSCLPLAVPVSFMEFASNCVKEWFYWLNAIKVRFWEKVVILP